MSLYSIIVVNNAPGCNTEIDEQVTTTGCTTYTVRLNPVSKATGPFNLYIDSTGNTPVYSALTRTELLSGVTVNLDCVPTQTPTPTVTATPGLTPTPTPDVTPTQTTTPTITPTQTITPTVTTTPGLTPTPTPSVTPPVYYAYLFPEPLDSSSQANLGQYMYDNGSDWYGFGNSNIQNYLSPQYSSDMDTYAHFSGFTGSVGNFITSVASLNSQIRQYPGTGVDSFGCNQSQYTFGTIELLTSFVNTNTQYNYTIWIPLNGVGGSMNNMTIDIGSATPCNSSIEDNYIPDGSLSQLNVTVTSGAVIPAGTYRILWNYTMPAVTPLTNTIYFKGDTKF